MLAAFGTPLEAEKLSYQEDTTQVIIEDGDIDLNYVILDMCDMIYYHVCDHILYIMND